MIGLAKAKRNKQAQKTNTPFFKNSARNVDTYGKKHPHMTRKKLIDNLAANLFLSVWTEDGSFDDVLERIDSDKHLPPQLKVEVYQKVMASVEGFVQRFSGSTTIDAKEVEKWLNEK